MRLDAPLTDPEREVLAGLAGFIPDRVFYAHARLWRRGDSALPGGMKVPLSGDGTIRASPGCWRR